MNTFANSVSKKHVSHMYLTCIPLSPTSHLVPDSCMSPVLCPGVTLCWPCTGPAANPTPLLTGCSASAVRVTRDCSLLACAHHVWKYSLVTATSNNSFHIITSSRHIIMSSSKVQGAAGTFNHPPFNFTELNWYREENGIMWHNCQTAQYHKMWLTLFFLQTCVCVQLCNLTRHY